MNPPLPPVLVVDDEKNMRLSLQTVLKDEGYSARAVESAEEALELLAREEFFMVITDARLGGMSGYEFLGKIRGRWPDLSALMLTAYATPKLAVKPSRPARLIIWPSRSRPKNCSMPSPAAPSATSCCGKTPRCGRGPGTSSALIKSSANHPKCANCASSSRPWRRRTHAC